MDNVAQMIDNKINKNNKKNMTWIESYIFTEIIKNNYIMFDKIYY